MNRLIRVILTDQKESHVIQELTEIKQKLAMNTKFIEYKNQHIRALKQELEQFKDFETLKAHLLRTIAFQEEEIEELKEKIAILEKSNKKEQGESIE